MLSSKLNSYDNLLKVHAILGLANNGCMPQLAQWNLKDCCFACVDRFRCLFFENLLVKQMKTKLLNWFNELHMGDQTTDSYSSTEQVNSREFLWCMDLWVRERNASQNQALHLPLIFCRCHYFQFFNLLINSVDWFEKPTVFILTQKEKFILIYSQVKTNKKEKQYQEGGRIFHTTKVARLSTIDKEFIVPTIN